MVENCKLRRIYSTDSRWETAAKEFASGKSPCDAPKVKMVTASSVDREGEGSAWRQGILVLERRGPCVDPAMRRQLEIEHSYAKPASSGSRLSSGGARGEVLLADRAMCLYTRD